MFFVHLAMFLKQKGKLCVEILTILFWQGCIAENASIMLLF